MKHGGQAGQPGGPPGWAGRAEGDGGDGADRIRERVRDGDRDAVAWLFDRYATVVYNHALRLTGDRSAAAEVLPETFLVAWRTRERVAQGTGLLRPWLLGIATNMARNHRRGAGRPLAHLAGRRGSQEVEDFADALAARMDDRRELPGGRGEATDRVAFAARPIEKEAR